jgi:NADH:ubiquinone oxidoreductase subunit 5 (subunit L)/multisubunit Na+/H+ antiporter MnhA subunit
MLLVLFKTTDYIIIFQLVSHMDFLNFSLLIFGFNGLEVITMLLLLGAIAKSAQIGLHV